MLHTFFVYGSLLLIMFICGIYASKKEYFYAGQSIPFNSWEVVIPLFLFAFIFGIRFNVGIDFENYLYSYKTGYDVERYEWLFRWITLFFQKCGFHYSFYFGFLSFIQIFFLFYAFKNERFLFPYLVFILFCGQYFLLWTNVIRQDIAACIFIYAVKYIEQKKKWSYFFWIFIACGFHITSVILFFLYPILCNGKDYFYRVKIQFILTFLFFFLYFQNVIIGTYLYQILQFCADLIGYDKKYTQVLYDELVLGKSSISTNTGLGFMLLFVIDLIVIFYSNRIKNYFNNKKIIILYNIYFIGVLLQLFFANFMVLSRSFRYFRFFKLIIVAYFLYYLVKNPKLSNTIVLLILILIYIALFLSIIFFGEKNNYLYECIFTI